MHKTDTIWSFCSGDTGGNAAGVHLLTEVISASTMQQIAQEVGYSETVFIQIMDSRHIKMRYFTPVEEVDLCGHATIAAFYWLLQNNHINVGEYVLVTDKARLMVWVDVDKIFMEQPPVQITRISKSNLNLLLDLSEAIDIETEIYAASTGITDLMLPFKTIAGLENFTPDFDFISQVCIKLGVQGIHAYSKSNDKEYYVRNFAPLLGINEESATGTSNCALSGLLDLTQNGSHEFTFLQGMRMEEPSIIYTRRLAVGQYSVGGSCRSR